jgi:CheY-like chemotaxis protein
MREKGGVLSVGLAGVRFEEETPGKPPELRPGLYFRLTVADTGCGMTPEVMERIFDPFFTTKQISEGTGMGLAVAHGIVKSHGGAITAESKPGQGSLFSVFLPQVEAAPEPLPQAIQAVPTGSERILFVDDEDIQLRSWKPALERFGYTVAVHSDGHEALRVFRARPQEFDLVIVDQTMPSITGAQLAAEMLRLRPGLPVILCTGFSAEINESRALDLGIREFLQKPFTVQELGEAIRRVLAPRAGGSD